MSKYIPYHEESVRKARELTAGMKDPMQKYSTVTHWVSKHFVYDMIRAVTIPKFGREFPDVEGCWKKRMGICMDISSMTTGMLRGVGVNAYMCYGHTEKNYHAWVEAHIKGKIYRYDFNGKAKKYKREKMF